MTQGLKAGCTPWVKFVVPDTGLGNQIFGDFCFYLSRAAHSFPQTSFEPGLEWRYALNFPGVAPLLSARHTVSEPTSMALLTEPLNMVHLKAGYTLEPGLFDFTNSTFCCSRSTVTTGKIQTPSGDDCRVSWWWVSGFQDIIIICVVVQQTCFGRPQRTSRLTRGPLPRLEVTISKLKLPTPRGPPPSALSRTMLMGPIRSNTRPLRKVGHPLCACNSFIQSCA